MVKREFKYQNESGNKQGNWYVNRLDYFEFHRFEKFNRYRIYCVIAILLSLSLFHFFNLFFSCILFYAIYIAVQTLSIFHSQTCRFKGYFLYPKRFITRLKCYKKEVDILDFDSIATMGNSGEKFDITNAIARNKQH
ncbi:MAG: hypothetical protein MJK12_07305 [Colwellia sp.]|nr:hypothetical protein [Colwellia sp.]